VTRDDPWEGSAASIDIAGADVPPERVRVSVVDANYFALFGVRLVAGRTMTLADAALSASARPVIVNRSFATELLGAGDPIGRRVRYRGYNGKVNPWLTIVGVVEDFPLGVKTPGFPITRTMYCLTVPGELTDAKIAIRFRGQSPETFAPTLRRIATSVSPMLQLTSISTLEANYRDFSTVGARLAAVVILIVGSVILLSAAGIHALMSFTVNQRRREIGIRTALGAPVPRIVTSILSRSARQLALGVGIGLTVALAGDQLSGNALMDGSGWLLIPATAAFMLVVGFLAASGPVRRGLRVDPTQTLRAE
jgi:hypothetical protein